MAAWKFRFDVLLFGGVAVVGLLCQSTLAVESTELQAGEGWTPTNYFAEMAENSPDTPSECAVRNTGCCCSSCCVDAPYRGCTDCGCCGFLGADRCGNYVYKHRLLKFIAPTDPRFNDFISPMTNPVYFEDPRTLTEARVIFLNHQIPGAVLGGGAVQLLAVQARLALTQRLSIIATKDGYIFAGSDAPPINGWADVNLGLKYNLYADPELQRLLSIGGSFALPVGSHQALQGNGDGQFDIFMTGGMQLGQLSHLVSSGGFRFPTNNNQQNSQFYWSTHLDRRLARRPLYGLLEFNWYHWMSSANSGLPGIEGLDLYNLGSSNVAGTDIVTGAVGLKYKLSALNEVGVAWEVPLTKRRDIIDNRITADLILRY